MYPRPPLLGTTSVNHIAGTVSATIIAAPGANNRLRFIGITGGINRNTGGIVDVRIRNGAGGETMFAALNQSVNGQSSFAYNLPEPGYQLDVNTLMQLECISTAGTGSTFVYVWYTIDGYNP